MIMESCACHVTIILCLVLSVCLHQDMGRDFKNKEVSLESVNARGTELVEGCKDDLSSASGRLKLSDLNDLWGDALSALSDREDKLKQGLALADKYQVSQHFHDGASDVVCKALLLPNLCSECVHFIQSLFAVIALLSPIFLQDQPCSLY